jgi:hypothetical protein
MSDDPLSLQSIKIEPKSATNGFRITTAASRLGTGTEITLHLPPAADKASLDVKLNGITATPQFDSCSAGSCSGIFTLANGVVPGKNLISATVRLEAGTMASARARFIDVGNDRVTGLQKSSQPISGISSSGTSSQWIGPTVPFETLTPGGFNGYSPWVSVNGAQYPTSAIQCVGGNYVAVVLNRQSLQYVDQQCFVSATDWSAYLAARRPSELVITGPTIGRSMAAIDTTPVGGSDLTSAAVARNYMLIGYGQAPGGTAFEFFEYESSVDSFASGMLQEDANGNYAFRPADMVEYAMASSDIGFYGLPAIRLKVPIGLAESGPWGAADTERIYTSGVSADSNGLWVLTLNRYSLAVPAGCSDQLHVFNGTQRVLAPCGAFFPVSEGNATAWSNLAAYLRQVGTDQLVFIQSVGKVGAGDSLRESLGVQNFGAFAQALLALGGTPNIVAGPTFTAADSYSFVGYRSISGENTPNALGGAVAEASTAMPGKGGILHGTLQRSRSGDYKPAQSAAEIPGMFWENGDVNGSAYVLSIAATQRPVAWPSSNPAQLLPGASSLSGQVAAYRFISQWLLSQYYIKGISGPYQDDIHYFFSGSSNTTINYHTMDPANLPFPSTSSEFPCTSAGGSTCTFTAFGDAQPSSFTANDFNAVKQQLSVEVLYLTNVMTYLVTGSSNLKDIVAAGNSNVALALSAAANSVMGSGMAQLNAQALAVKPVTFSWQNLLGTLAGIASAAANIEAAGELTPIWDAIADATKTTIKRGVGATNALGAILGTIGVGTTVQASDPKSTPQPFAKLTTTVGELATANLQSPLLGGFDAVVDSLTSDWGRLSLIGPRITNTADTVFYSPDQVSQQRSIDASTLGSTQTFYLAVLPTVFTVHYWQGLGWGEAEANYGKFFQPTVGSVYDNSGGNDYYAFYVTPNRVRPGSTDKLGTLSLYQGTEYPSYADAKRPFMGPEDEAPPHGYWDFWVIDNVNAVQNKNSKSTYIPSIDLKVATQLFAPNLMNIPMDQFVALNGPMKPIDASVNNGSGFSNTNIFWADSGW